MSYIIPGNDDSIRSIQLYTECVANGVLEGRGSNPDIAQDEFVEIEEVVVEVRASDEEEGSSDK